MGRGRGEGGAGRGEGGAGRWVGGGEGGEKRGLSGQMTEGRTEVSHKQAAAR